MNFSGKYEEAHCQALSMKADSKFGFISSSLLIGLGVLALIFSSWQLISFDAEENKLGLIKDKTIEPSDRNTGYRIYIVKTLLLIQLLSTVMVLHEIMNWYGKRIVTLTYGN
jgi:hypothetical protein